jgi:hypothetical protein
LSPPSFDFETSGIREAGALQELVGVRLDAVVVVNLAGFVQLVDAIGGLWIDVPEQLVDRNYPLEDGMVTSTATSGLAASISTGEWLSPLPNRATRTLITAARRQQAVLLALARDVDPIAQLPKVPNLLKIAANNLWTTVPRSEVRTMGELAARAGSPESDPRPRHSDRLADVSTSRTRQDSGHGQVRGPRPDAHVRRLRARLRFHRGGAALPSWHGFRRSIAVCVLPGDATGLPSPRTPTTSVEPRKVPRHRRRRFARPTGTTRDGRRRRP